MDDFANVSELYGSVTDIACIFGILLNAVLLVIVINKTPARLQKYNPVMACICLANILYAVSTYAIHAVRKPAFRKRRDANTTAFLARTCVRIDDLPRLEGAVCAGASSFSCPDVFLAYFPFRDACRRPARCRSLLRFVPVSNIQNIS
jgi:hypothetical protein